MLAGASRASSAEGDDPPSPPPVLDDLSAEGIVTDTMSEDTVVSGRASANDVADGSVGMINCTLHVHDPHPSSHQPGTVNVEGDITCTAPVSRLQFTMYLYKRACTPDCRWVLYANGQSQTRFDVSKITANAAGTCTSGTYKGYGYGTVTAPPGFSPPMLYLYGDRNSVKQVDC
jgi:hypothetical protein